MFTSSFVYIYNNTPSIQCESGHYLFYIWCRPNTNDCFQSFMAIYCGWKVQCDFNIYTQTDITHHQSTENISQFSYILFYLYVKTFADLGFYSILRKLFVSITMNILYMVFWIQFSFFVKGHNDSFLRDFIYFGFSSTTKRFFHFFILCVCVCVTETGTKYIYFIQPYV